MYGTVARMTIKPGMESRLQELLREYESLNIPGAVREIAYRMDANPREFYLAVVFESKEAYLANARSPEQDARYRKLREILASDPEWHDGEVIYRWG